MYRQESGNDFDGNQIVGKYRSPDLTMGDAGIRKNFQRVIINYAPEAAVNADLFVRYDYEAPDAARPAAYPFDTSTVVAVWFSYYNTSTYGGQTNPLVRQPVEGSGFAVALRVNDREASAPYSLKGFQLEFDAGAKTLMAGYTRQSSYTDGDVITAAHSNDEFNQVLAAFVNTTGHKHDGTAAEGPVIGLIGDPGETTPKNKVVVDDGK